jgi:hypothetical protein
MSKCQVVFAFLSLAGASGLYAQSESASVVGTVTDASGAAMPGVTVSLKNTRTNATFNVQTAGDGNYISPSLQPGSYSVTAGTQGFTTIIQNLNLDVDQHARLDFALKPGQVSESVTVEANTAMLETQSAELGNVRTTQAINDLPINGRDFFALTYLAPGTSSSGTGYTMARGAANQIGLEGVAVNGIRNTGNTTYFDGILSQDNEYSIMVLLPSQDAIQEFKMQSSGRDATTGHTGGALVNLVTKSGGNDFHGAAFEFFRNSDLDARNYFDPPQIPAFHQNQFGASLGGRIKRDKTFFFMDIQKAYTIQGQSFLQTVPTALERQGIFTQLSNVIYNPYTTAVASGVTTRQPFPGNIIPTSMLNPTGVTIMNMYPLPNRPGLANNFSYNPPRTLAPIQGDLRLDHRFSDSDSMFARYSNSTSGAIVNPGYFPQYAGGPSFPGDFWSTGNQIVLSYTHVFSPSFLSEFRAGYTRLYNHSVPFILGTNFMDQIGIPGIDGYGYALQGVSTFTITGADTVGGSGGSVSLKDTNNYQYSWHLSWVHDKHSVKWGYDLFRRGMNFIQEGDGAFTFSGQFTQNPASAAGTGSGLADALLGLDSAASLMLLQETGTRRWEHGLYVQDDYRVANKLTLNLGLRWEAATPWTEIHNRLSNLDFSNGIVYPVGTPQMPGNTLSNAHGRDFGPRVGLSYQLMPKTVIRASFGLFYDFTAGIVNDLGTNGPPGAGTLAITNNVNATNLVTGITPLSQGFLPYQTLGNLSALGQNLVYIPRNDPDTSIMQRHVSIQQQLTPNTVLTVAYVGTQGEHLTDYPNINQPVPGPGAAGPRRLFSQYGSVTGVVRATSSEYNGLQVSGERRFSHGLAFLASYTWGHAIDVSSSSGSGGANQNPLCLECDRSPSDFDIRQSLVLSWSYELPFGKGKTFGNNWDGPLQAFFGGWKLNSIDTFQSGSPFSVDSGTNTEGSGAGTQRANVIGNYHVTNPGPTEWFNPAAFTAPPAYTYGNSGRNIIVGPGTSQVDLSLFKNIPLKWREGMRLEYRTEVFNLFNKPQFNNPNESGATAGAATIGIPTAGTLNYAGNPTFFQRTSREIQLALKLYF